MKTLDLLKANFVNRFIRSDGDDTVNGHTRWGDGKQVQLGNSADHRSYHDGSNTYHDNNTGGEYHRQNVHGGSVYHQAEDTNGSRKTIFAIIGGATPYFKAYFAGATKFTTTSIGTETVGSHNATEQIKEAGQRVFSPRNRNISDTVGSTSQTVYASSKAVKTAYDRGSQALTAANAKWTYVQATLSAYGATKLSSAVNSTSESLAATPKAVKAAYDLAASKITQATADGRYLSKTAKATLTDDDGVGHANLVGNHKGGVPVRNGSSYRLKMDTNVTTATMSLMLGNSVTAGVAKTLTSIWNATTSAFDVKVNLLEKGQRVFSPNNRNISNSVSSTSTTVYASLSAVRTAYNKGVEGLNKANQALSAANGKWTYVTATLSRYGAVKLSSAVNSTSEALAATPKAVKAAYDLAASKITKVQGDSYYLGKTATSANSNKLGNVVPSGYSRAYHASFGTGGGNWTTAQLVAWLTSVGAFNQSHWSCRCSWSYAGNRVITDTGLGTILLAGCTIEVMGNASNYTIRILTPSTSSSGGRTNAEFVYTNNGSSYSPTWRRVYSTHDKPTKSDVGLPSVVNAGQTSAVNNSSTTTYATAKGVKTAYDKAIEALNKANSKVGAGDTIAKANWADTVDVNTSTSTSWYNMMWHSGDTVYGTNGKIQYRPSDGYTKFNGGVQFAAEAEMLGGAQFHDNDYLWFGTGKDVEFFCNGSHMYTDLNSGIGNWYIRDGSTIRFTFDDAGHFYATGKVGNASDARLKENVRRIENALDKTCALNGYIYDKKLSLDSDITFPEAGVIAQEVEKILPEVVDTSEDKDQIKSVAYGNMVGLLIEAIKEERAKREALEEEVSILRTAHDKLSEDMKLIKEKIGAL